MSAERGEPQLLGAWTLRQRGHDPTGSAAQRGVDGLAGVAELLAEQDTALYLPRSTPAAPRAFLDEAAFTGTNAVAAIRDEWCERGLTRRQAEILILHESGFTQEELAAEYRIARSTVANTVATARRKLRGTPKEST